MIKLFKLVGELSVSGIKQLNDDLYTLESKLKKSLKSVGKFGRQAERTGMQLTKTFSVPLGLLGGSLIKFSGDFQKAMATSTAIMGDLDEATKKQLEMRAKQISVEGKTIVSADELAKVYYYLASAGYTAEQSLSALEKVASFATAGQFDLQIATDLLTDAQSALGLSTKDAVKNEENLTRVSDVLVKANTLANASVQQFSEALTNKAGAALRILGKDVEEGVAVLSAYADQGVKGQEAGTQLGIVLRDLQKATLDNSDEFRRNKIDVYDASGEMRNMSDIIRDLEEALKGKSDAYKKATLSLLGFQEKSVASLLTLIGTSEKIKEYEEKLRSAAGTTDEITKKQLTNFNDQLKILINRLQIAAINLGEKLLPVIEDSIIPMFENFIIKIEYIVKWFTHLNKATQKSIISFGLIVAALGPVLLIIGKLSLALQTLPYIITSIRLAFIALNSTMLLNPFVLVAAAVVALGVHIFNLEKRYKELAKVHNSTLKILTQEQSKQAEYVKTVENINKKMLENKDILNDESKLTNILGKDIENLTNKARNLNYIVEGNNTEKLKSLLIIDAEIRQLRDATGSLIKYKKEKKDVVEEDKKKHNEEIINMEDINTIIKLMHERTDKIKKQKEEEIRLANIQKKNSESVKNWEKEIAETRDNINKEYIEKTAITSDERISILEDEMKSELAAASAYGADKTNIEKYYNNEIDKIRQEDLQKERDKQFEKVNLVNNFVKQAGGILSGFYSNQAIAQENEYKRDKKRIENSEMKEKDKTNAIEALDEKYDKKKISLQKKQMLAEKAQAIFSIGINTISAAVKALPNMILSGVISAFGLAQAAIVASKPIPELKEGGIIKKRIGGTLVNAGEAGEDEGFVPMEKGTASIAKAIMSNMKRYEAGNLIGSENESSLIGNTNINVGTLIADDNSLREFARKLKPILTSENNRLGIV